MLNCFVLDCPLPILMFCANGLSGRYDPAEVKKLGRGTEWYLHFSICRALYTSHWLAVAGRSLRWCESRRRIVCDGGKLKLIVTLIVLSFTRLCSDFGVFSVGEINRGEINRGMIKSDEPIPSGESSGRKWCPKRREAVALHCLTVATCNDQVADMAPVRT